MAILLSSKPVMTWPDCGNHSATAPFQLKVGQVDHWSQLHLLVGLVCQVCEVMAPRRVSGGAGGVNARGPGKSAADSRQNKLQKQEQEDESLQRRLCKFLRHEAENNSVSPEGFMSLTTLMNLPAFRRWRAYSRDDVARVVRSCPKSRLQLKGDKIRAVQGHTIRSVTQTGVPWVPDVVHLLHATSVKGWLSDIRSVGLDRMARNHVHFTTGLNEHLAKRPILVQVDVSACIRHGLKFEKADNGVVLTEGPVPLHCLALVTWSCPDARCRACSVRSARPGVPGVPGEVVLLQGGRDQTDQAGPKCPCRHMVELELKCGQVIGCCTALATAAEAAQPGIRIEALRARLGQLAPEEVRSPSLTEVEDEEADDFVISLSEEESEAEEMVECQVWELGVPRRSGGCSRLVLVELPEDDGEHQFKLLQGAELDKYDQEQANRVQLPATTTTGLPVQILAASQAPPPRPPLPIPLPAPAAHHGNPYLAASQSCGISAGMGQALQLTPGPSRPTGGPLTSHSQCQESKPGGERRGLAQPSSLGVQTRKRKLGK